MKREYCFLFADLTVIILHSECRESYQEMLRTKTHSDECIVKSISSRMAVGAIHKEIRSLKNKYNIDGSFESKDVSPFQTE